ncbi:YqzE family protein [Salirhabdus sp. Marseille-P4669]|uniref:YqzE family protein n=1 Tax=Salirhabdus sp. Marseille-P4669 TaxID=2042310 RepID=UPI000C7DCF6D|nr:YqzE family protein [Salirhabdus sp. Marseille-P4669]
MNDIVKYMTQEVLKYMHLPKDEKQKRKMDKKQYKSNRSTRYFGVVPAAVKMMVKSKKKGS